jgi:hypothetical protein
VISGSDERIYGDGSVPKNKKVTEIETHRVTFAQSRLHFLLLSCASAASTGRFVPSTRQPSTSTIQNEGKGEG